MDEDIKKDEPEQEIKTPQDEAGELEQSKQRCEEYLNNWKRERADFLNYKKEEVERIGMLEMYTKEGTILKMLPILDSIYLAEKSRLQSNAGSLYPDDKSSGSGQVPNSWVEGFMQIQKQIDTFLKKEGIEKIEAIDKPFDPNTMEAVEEVENKEMQPGMVIEEIQRGYMMGGKVLRPARVRITK